jgi:hypothetical protein
MPIDYSAGAVERRLAGTLDPLVRRPIAMSAHAIESRLSRVSELRRLCFALVAVGMDAGLVAPRIEVGDPPAE